MGFQTTSYYANGKFSHCTHYIKWERQTWLPYLKEAAFQRHGKPVHSHFHTNTATGKHSSLNSTPENSLHVNRTFWIKTTFKTNPKISNKKPHNKWFHVMPKAVPLIDSSCCIKKKPEKLECGKCRILHVWFLVPRIHYSLKSLWVTVNDNRRNIKVPLIFHYIAIWKVLVLKWCPRTMCMLTSYKNSPHLQPYFNLIIVHRLTKTLDLTKTIFRMVQHVFIFSRK